MNLLKLAAVAVLGLSVHTAQAEAASTLVLDRESAALLITDPQNDFLATDGVAYGLFSDNLKQLNTIDNIGALFTTAHRNSVPVFVSPHAYYSHDDRWQFRGALQQTMHELGVFHSDNGTDFLAQYREAINHKGTTVTSPHKVYGPESNDLVLQLRKRGVQTVLIGGLAANLCTDSHMRELVEQGFEVILVRDAVGAPGEAAYQAALTNYGLIASAVVSTEQARQLLRGKQVSQ